MGTPAKPGSATVQQLRRLKAAIAAGDHDPRLVAGYAKNARNDASRHEQRFARAALPALSDWEELSMSECSALIRLLEDANATGRRLEPICLRCARLGFVQEPGARCMHDGGTLTDRDRAVDLYEAGRGRRSW